uniref:DB domain-containing protein n=1 Tax=Ascaris lumbricoides TaxID=6252 RepID=A0A0M3IIH2_ASCLU
MNSLFVIILMGFTSYVYGQTFLQNLFSRVGGFSRLGGPLPLTNAERLVGVAQPRLRKCCKHLTNVDYECERRFCNFEALNPSNVHFFVSMCGSRRTTFYDLWDCTSSKQDHTQCCINKGVSEGCLAYCDATYGLRSTPTQLLHCSTYLNPIRECFWEYMQTNTNMYGEY